MVIDYIRIDKKRIKERKNTKKERKHFRREARKQIQNVRCLVKAKVIEQPISTKIEISFLHMMQELQEQKRHIQKA